MKQFEGALEVLHRHCSAQFTSSVPQEHLTDMKPGIWKTKKEYSKEYLSRRRLSLLVPLSNNLRWFHTHNENSLLHFEYTAAYYKGIVKPVTYVFYPLF